VKSAMNLAKTHETTRETTPLARIYEVRTYEAKIHEARTYEAKNDEERAVG